jgi:CheY-like chemotaxis protein
MDLGQFVNRMAPFLRTVREGTGPISYRVDAGVTVLGDVGQLQHLVVNLVENAQEAVAEHGDGEVRVKVSTATFDSVQTFDSPGSHGRLEPGTYACLSVTDTGNGMDEDTLVQAFDPFFTTKFTGRGLGLASVLGIVRGHQGALCVSSRIGSGTTVSVFLPLAASASVHSEEDEDTIAPIPGRGFVLVADEEALVANVARKILERYGYGVVSVPSLEEVRSAIDARHEELDCILLDCGLLRDPLATVLELRVTAPTVGILLTSDSDESPIDLGELGGKVQYLRKPYLPRELMRRVLAASVGKPETPAV